MHYYVIEEGILSPSWFNGPAVAEIDARGRFLNADFQSGQNIPPPGTKMVKVWTKLPGEKHSVLCAVTLDDFEENERAAAEAARAAELEREAINEGSPPSSRRTSTPRCRSRCAGIRPAARATAPVPEATPSITSSCAKT